VVNAAASRLVVGPKLEFRAAVEQRRSARSDVVCKGGGDKSRSKKMAARGDERPKSREETPKWAVEASILG
jgi:hypothetical protein